MSRGISNVWFAYGGTILDYECLVPWRWMRSSLSQNPLMPVFRMQMTARENPGVSATQNALMKLSFVRSECVFWQLMSCSIFSACYNVSWQEFLNLLRFPGNELRMPQVGVGTRDAYLVIRSDDQLANRFEPVVLPLWEASENCCSLLASLAALLPLWRPSPIATQDMARYLLAHSVANVRSQLDRTNLPLIQNQP